MKTVAIMFATFLSLLIAFALPGARRALAADADAKAAAREHFQKGLAAYADERFAEAADEFAEAYRLSPAFKILYNIGQVNVALGRSVEAVDAFDRYVKQGASTIPAERRREVAAEIEKQRARIGVVSIRTLPVGADVRIDGVLVGQTPMGNPVRLNAGRHTIEASLSGHSTQTRELDVSGRAEIAIELALEAIVVPAPNPAPPASSVKQPTTPAQAPVIQPPPPVVLRVISERPMPAPAPVEGEKARIERVPSPAQTPPASSVSWQRIGGIVIIAAGIATATVGGVDAYRGANQTNDATNRLANATTGAEYDAAKPDYDAGKRLNQRGWIIAGVGAALFVGGVVLVATVPERSNAVSLAPWVTAGSGGAIVTGAW